MKDTRATVLSRILFVSIHCRVKSTMLNNTVIVNIYVYFFYYLLIKTLVYVLKRQFSQFLFDRKCCSK